MYEFPFGIYVYMPGCSETYDYHSRGYKTADDAIARIESLIADNQRYYINKWPPGTTFSIRDSRFTPALEVAVATKTE